MWLNDGRLQTIAYPVDQLPRFDSKRDLARTLDPKDLEARRQQSEALMDELVGAADGLPEGAGHIGEQVSDSVIDSIDWASVISQGNFDSIRTADPYWRLDLAAILDDLLYLD